MIGAQQWKNRVADALRAHRAEEPAGFTRWRDTCLTILSADTREANIVSPLIGFRGDNLDDCYQGLCTEINETRDALKEFEEFLEERHRAYPSDHYMIETMRERCGDTRKTLNALVMIRKRISGLFGAYGPPGASEEQLGWMK